MPEGAREILRVRIDATNTVRMVQVSLPELVPDQYAHDRMVGKVVGQFGPESFRAPLLEAMTLARTGGGEVRIEWPAYDNYLRLRIGVFHPHPGGALTLRVFAEAAEVADLPDRRTAGSPPAG